MKIDTTILREEKIANYSQHFSNHELKNLIEECLGKNRISQKNLYQMYYGKMMGLAMRYFINRDDALDALNKGFLKVFQNLDKYGFIGSFDGWVYKVIFRVIMDTLRQGIDRKRMELDVQNISEIAWIKNPALENLYAEDLLKLLQQLPHTTRAVFNLFAIDCKKHKEIASLLNISEGTSKWHVNEAKKRLKNLIERKNE